MAKPGRKSTSMTPQTKGKERDAKNEMGQGLNPGTPQTKRKANAESPQSPASKKQMLSSAAGSLGLSSLMQPAFDQSVSPSAKRAEKKQSVTREMPDQLNIKRTGLQIEQGSTSRSAVLLPSQVTKVAQSNPAHSLKETEKTFAAPRSNAAAGTETSAPLVQRIFLFIRKYWVAVLFTLILSQAVFASRGMLRNIPEKVQAVSALVQPVPQPQLVQPAPQVEVAEQAAPADNPARYLGSISS